MNWNSILTQGQIASALLIIAVVLVYFVFSKKPTKPKK